MYKRQEWLEAKVEALQLELDKWKPLTPEEAQRAYDEAEAAPISERRMQEILKAALDPATSIPNNEAAQMAVEIKRLKAQIDELQLNDRIRSDRDAVLHAEASEAKGGDV